MSDQVPDRAALADMVNPVYVAKYMYNNHNFVLAAVKIIGMAMALIYVGAHASLHRPPSAAPPKSKSTDKDKDKKKLDKNVGQELGLSDALKLPILATCGLCSMYALIKYIGDASIISKFMRFSVVFYSVMAGGSLSSGALGLVKSVVFPRVWTSRDGTRIYRINEAEKQQSWTAVQVDDNSTEEPVWTVDKERSTPFPDAIARFVPDQFVPRAWALRALLRKKWYLKFLVTALDFEEDEAYRTVFDFVGHGFSTVVCILYIYFSDLSKPGMLNNILGLGITFFSLTQISGTSLVISSAIQVAMFVYDVVMVFYTPIMITVASGVQAPMMVVATARVPGAESRRAGLGLGDLVVPGIFICVCLRFDLYRFYCSKIKDVTTALEQETRAVVNGQSVTTVSTIEASRTVKAAYVSPCDRWGDWLWTGALRKSSAAVTEKLAPGVAAAAFPKTFFHTAMVGYLVGLVLADAAVEYTSKGQPAMFYIVPVMLFVTWAQGWYKGCLKQMCEYTEDGSLDTEDVVVDVVTEKGEDKKEEAQAAIEDKAEGVSTGLSARELRAQKRSMAKAA